MKLVGLLLLLFAAVALGEPLDNGYNRVSKIDFHNTPVQAVIETLVLITDLPVIADLHLAGGVNYHSTTDITVNEAVAGLTSALSSNGWTLVNVENRYFRLSSTPQTNEVPHLEIQIESDKILFENEVITAENLVEVIQKRMTPDTEIWIYDAQSSWNEKFNSISTRLLREKWKVCRAFARRGAFAPH